MTKKIIVVYERFQDSKKIVSFLKNKNYDVISLDFNSHIQLTDLKIKHTIFDSKLSESEKDLISNTLFEIVTSWYKHPKFKKVLTKFGINLGWLLEQESYSSFLSVIGTFYLLIKIKQIENPDEIIISHDLLEMASSIFCNTKIETFEEENKEKEMWNFDKYAVKYNFKSIPITIRTPRKLFFKLRTCYERFFIPFFNRFIIKKSLVQNSILLVDFNASLYPIFLEKLSQKNKNIFLLNRRRPAIWNFSSFTNVKNSDCIPISYEQFLDQNQKNKIKEIINDLNIEIDELFFNKKELEEIFSINGFSFWNYLQKYFSNYCKDRFNEAIYEIFGAKELLSSMKPNVLVHFFEPSLQEKILIFYARQQNISSIILQHGTPHLTFPGFTKLNPIHGTLPFYDDKKIAFWGEIMKTYALQNGIKEQNIVLTGSPRHDSYFESKKTQTNLDNDVILVTLGQLDKKNFGSQLTSVYQNYEKALEIICHTLKKIKNKQKIIKLHPGDMVWKSVTVEPIIRSIDPTIEIIVEGDLKKIIQSANLVITVGLTTVLLEANIFEKPTMTILPDPQELFSASSSGHSKIFTVDERDKFENYFDSIMQNKNNAVEKSILQGNDFVKKYLSNPGTASDFLANLLETY